MTQFAIFVTIKLHPGRADDFRPFILENAEAAVRDEPDCHEFRVLTDESDPETFFFFEVYTDAAGLDAHRQTPHFKKFSEGTQEMVAERTIQRCALIQ